MTTDSEPSADSTPVQFEPVRLRANRPSPRFLWAFLLFFIAFIVLASGAALIDPTGDLAIYALLLSIILFLFVWLYPGPRYGDKLEIHHDRVQVAFGGESAVELLYEDIRLIAVQPRLNLSNGMVDDWGCLFLVTPKFRYALLFQPSDVVGTYRILTKRMPAALGIGGDGKIDMPAISDLGRITEYVLEQRRLLGREFGRTILRTSAISLNATLILGVCVWATNKSELLRHLHGRRWWLPLFVLSIAGGLWYRVFQSVRHRAKVLSAFSAALRGEPIDEKIIRQRTEDESS